MEVDELKKFPSKAKKEDLIVKVQSTWKLISEKVMFSNTDDTLDKNACGHTTIIINIKNNVNDVVTYVFKCSLEKANACAKNQRWYD